MFEFENFYNEYAPVAAKPSTISPPDLPSLPSDTVVAMAYVPFQQLRSVYGAEDGLRNGTLFPCLNKPFIGKAV
ncbi:MAG: spore coat associated protein CotJA [Clostridia bacterium]|nr:spore coat associated protein CotJA [Clostridia bacterium]